MCNDVTKDDSTDGDKSLTENSGAHGMKADHRTEQAEAPNAKDQTGSIEVGKDGEKTTSSEQGDDSSAHDSSVTTKSKANSADSWSARRSLSSGLGVEDGQKYKLTADEMAVDRKIDEMFAALEAEEIEQAVDRERAVRAVPASAVDTILVQGLEKAAYTKLGGYKRRDQNKQCFHSLHASRESTIFLIEITILMSKLRLNPAKFVSCSLR